MEAHRGKGSILKEFERARGCLLDKFDDGLALNIATTHTTLSTLSTLPQHYYQIRNVRKRKDSKQICDMPPRTKSETNIIVLEDKSSMHA